MPRVLISIAIGVAAVMSCAAVAAQAPDSHSMPLRRGFPVYGGLVVNQTLTVAGQEFYRQFASAWRESGLSERFTVSVHEQASARWGSRIRIEYAQTALFQAALPAARSAMPELGRQAAEAVRQRIVDVEVGRRLFREADLGADEI